MWEIGLAGVRGKAFYYKKSWQIYRAAFKMLQVFDENPVVSRYRHLFNQKCFRLKIESMF